MTNIVLNDEQAKVITSTLKPVQVQDAKGNTLGVIQPAWTEDDIAEAKRILASKEPWFTTEQLLAYLRSLEQK